MNLDRRSVLAGTAAILATSAGTSETARGATFAREGGQRRTFVLVPGSWHSSGIWEKVAFRLTAAGHATIQVDRPGRGVNALFPQSYIDRPLNPAAAAQEASPVAGVTRDQEIDVIVSRIRAAVEGGSGPVILVAHSSSGLANTEVVERFPELVGHIVYFAAQMPNPGVTGLQDLQSPENIVSFNAIAANFLANPLTVGALRLDWNSQDPAYFESLRNIFYNDVTTATFRSYANLLTPDDPVQPFTIPIVKTVERWGSVPRSYIRTSLDNSFLPALQDRLIAQANAFAPRNPTFVYRLNSSHSPFVSQPENLADILLDAARRTRR